MKETSDRTVRTERRGPVLIITLDRPGALNAINRATSQQLHTAFDQLQDDGELAVGVLTGTGRAFCAGSDLKEIDERPAFTDGLRHGNVTSLVRRDLGKPLVAAVNGLAFGGGMELVLACDLAVAGPPARFGLPEVKHGLVAAAGGLLRGPRQLPIKVLLDLVLTGGSLDADQALARGLVSRIAEDPVAEAITMAATIAGHPSQAAVRASRDAVRRGLDVPLEAEGGAWDVVEPDVMAVLLAAGGRS
ncbi:enoyl-CoA hydratase/isomerase family protein [Nocardioides jensenii]|uniref:enoyl-CoA hydratase/isomerase family protein n=1 Tax=Nocardioides jensenii TaxID=1843 RepID=UPI00082CC82E|nr:enoyl-CoA hydratase-related protein [Nocardioides jensenii]